MCCYWIDEVKWTVLRIANYTGKGFKSIIFLLPNVSFSPVGCVSISFKIVRPLRIALKWHYDSGLCLCKFSLLSFLLCNWITFTIGISKIGCSNFWFILCNKKNEWSYVVHKYYEMRWKYETIYDISLDSYQNYQIVDVFLCFDVFYINWINFLIILNI